MHRRLRLKLQVRPDRRPAYYNQNKKAWCCKKNDGYYDNHESEDEDENDNDEVIRNHHFARLPAHVVDRLLSDYWLDVDHSASAAASATASSPRPFPPRPSKKKTSLAATRYHYQPSQDFIALRVEFLSEECQNTDDGNRPERRNMRTANANSVVYASYNGGRPQERSSAFCCGVCGTR